MKRLVRTRLAALLSATLLLLTTGFAAEPAQAKTMPAHTWYATVGVENYDHAIQGMLLLPKNLWIDVGDTVVFTAKGADIHTVTILAPNQTRPPFNDSDPLQTMPQGGPVYTGPGYYNSGLLSDLSGAAHAYSLRFDAKGDIQYICLVHQMMMATIHVRAKGTPYPFTQEDYDEQVQAAHAAVLREGHALFDRAYDIATKHLVIVGIGNGAVDIMRFVWPTIHIHKGDTVTFENLSTGSPHTVTYGPDQPSGPFAPYGTPGAFDGTTPLNSGLLGVGFPFGTVFKVTFTKAGTFAFHCALHDNMGMVMQVVVN